MPEKYKDRIEVYCKQAGIEIPIGFYRHSASRYAVIDLELTPPKLVAKTWFKQEDAVYYLVNLSAGRKTRVLDFKERCELVFNGKSTLERGNAF
jgi:hypothetical protein